MSTRGNCWFVYLPIIIWTFGINGVFTQADDTGVRLSNGMSSSEGRVEVLHNGEWGTVCDDDWDLQDTTVVCRYLGHRYAVSAFAWFGEGTGNIHLDDVNCNGNESSLEDCSHAGWGVHNCDHSDDVGVICSASNRTQQELLFPVGHVRLVGGSSSSEGRLEVYMPDQWGTVCDDHWSLRDATVICRQLGFSSVASELIKFSGGSGPILLDDVSCTGNEARLADCPHEAWGRHDCTHEEDVGMVCSNSTAKNKTLPLPEDEKMYRLFGGASRREGFLQFRSSTNETWNILCSSASVVFPGVGAHICRQVGYNIFCGSDIMGSVHGVGGLGNFPLKTAGIACRLLSEGGFACGLEATAEYFHACTREEAIWMTCDSDVNLRLAYGVFENEGVLQVRCSNSEEWTFICGDNWGVAAHAHQVACRHLGFGEAMNASSYAMSVSTLSGSTKIMIASVLCSGMEDKLTKCDITQPVPSYCSSYAGLKCGSGEQSLEVKLVDSAYSASGFVVGRVGPEEDWGAICGQPFDERDSHVLCRQLGFSGSIPVYRGLHNSSAMPSSILVSRVGCSGSESDLSQCELVPDVGTTCGKHVYIECKEETTRFDVPAYLCGEIHYCGFDCNQGPHNTLRPIEQETCKCDNACAFFNDCCYDYRSNCKQDRDRDWKDVSLNGVSLQYYECASIPSQLLYRLFGYAMVSFCPERWKDPIIQQSCEEMAGEGDVIGSLPVNNEQGAVYKNVFCAVCHGVKPENIRKWTVKLEYAESEKTTYDSRFNLTVNGILTGRYLFEPPSDAPGSVALTRTCPVRTVGSCLREFANTSLEEACRDYFAPLTVHYTRFRNPHCAMCNGVVTEPYADCGPLCKPICSAEDKWSYCGLICAPFGSIPTVEALFDFGWGGDESSCKPGQLFDPFLNRCRTVLCVSGITKEDGGCVSDTLSLTVPSPQWFSLLDDTCNELLIERIGPDVVYWQVVPNSGSSSVTSPSKEFTLTVIARRLQLIQNFREDLLGMLQNATAEIELCNITTATIFVLEGAQLLSEFDSCSNFTLLASDIIHPSRNSSFDLSVILPMFTLNKLDGSHTSPQECTDVLGLNCSQLLMLSPNEYIFQAGATSIMHTSTGLQFRSTEFVAFPDGKVAICGPVRWTDPRAFALGIVSLVCSCLSLLALTATFVTYCCLSKLRNVAGLYTMNLVVALFAAILILLLAGNPTMVGHSCVVVASLQHFSWLSAFFWMATLSYNIARTFGGKNALPRGSDRSCRRLLTTMAIVWGSALLIVSLCLALNFCNCTNLPSIYSESPPCLVAKGPVLLVVIGVPVTTSLLFSTVCFIIVVISVRKTKRDSKMVQNKGQTEEMLEEVKIYVKLSLLFGLTWVLAFVSGAVNHVVLSYIDVIINTSQGLFIFIVFCLNQRVRALWRKRLPCLAGDGPTENERK